MKKNLTVLALLLALAALLLTGCQEAQQTADLRILLDESGSRILSPKDPADFKVEKYRVTCKPGNGTSPIELETIRTSFVIQDLPIGEYTIAATGLNASGDDIVTGSTVFSLSHTNTTATVVLGELIGSGNVNISFTWDGNLIEEPSVHVTLTPRDEQATSIIEEDLTVQNNSAAFTHNDLPAGSYTVTAQLFDGGTMVAGCVEALRIGQDSTVNGSISFDLDELPSSVGNITLENQAGIPVECRVVGLENDADIEAQKEITVSLDDSGLDEVGLDIEWYLDGVLLGKGGSISFTPEPGSHRLDVVASTHKLGSTGSTQIRFEAALLGAEGLPVIGGIVDEDELTLGPGAVIEFLQDGRVLVIDNVSSTAQVCTIVRNTLRVENSQELTGSVVAAQSVPNTDKVVLAYENGESVVYNYNKATGLLQNPMSNNGWYAEDIIRYERTIAVIPNLAPHGYEGHFGTIGRTEYVDPSLESYNGHTVMGVHTLYNEDESQSSEIMYYLPNDFQDIMDIVTMSYSGNDGLVLDRETGTVALWTNGYDARDNKDLIARWGEINVDNPTAACVLPPTKHEESRFVVADEDRLRFYSVPTDGHYANQDFTSGETLMRSEGSELATTSMLMDSSERFLYALNQGNDSISAYEAMDNGSLKYLGMCDLPFTPDQAWLSANSEYMLTLGTEGELAVLRIKTSPN